MPAQVRWIALGGAQRTCNLLSCTDAQYLSWLLSAIWQFAHELGDGVVSTASATAINSHILNSAGGEATIERWNMVLPLDHLKQVLDSQVFGILGELNTRWIDDQQALVYQSILKQI